MLVPSTSLLGSERLFLFLFMVECMYLYLYAWNIILTGLVRIVYECAPLCQYSTYIIVVAVGVLLKTVLSTLSRILVPLLTMERVRLELYIDTNYDILLLNPYQ